MAAAHLRAESPHPPTAPHPFGEPACGTASSLQVRPQYTVWQAALEEAELQAEERGREALESIQALERQRDEATAGADAPIATEKEAERASLLAKVVSLEAECESHLALCEAHAGKMKELEEQGGGQAARIKELEVPLA